MTTTVQTLPTSVRTVIVGGGFSGLCAAIQLKRHGDEDFVVIERQDDLGGHLEFQHLSGSAV